MGFRGRLAVAPALCVVLLGALVAGFSSHSFSKRSFESGLKCDEPAKPSDWPSLNLPRRAGTNGRADITVAPSATVTNVSVASLAAGGPPATGNGHSGTMPFNILSTDGRYLVFVSLATDLVPGQTDTNGIHDVFLHDRVTGTTTLVSRAAGSTTTTGNAQSLNPVISDDGRYIAYNSISNNLVAGQVDTNGVTDVFLFDAVTETTTLVSHVAASSVTTGTGFSQFPFINGDGRFIAFESSSNNLFVGLSDTNSSTDVFLFDRMAGTTSLVSRNNVSATTTGAGRSDKPSISADGAFIAFRSFASDLVVGQVDANAGFDDVFVLDRVAGTTALVSRSAASALTTGNGPSGSPVISRNGNVVMFSSLSTNLVTGQTDTNADNDVFLHDRTSGTTTLASRASVSATTTGNNSSNQANDISADGNVVAFSSRATNLLPGITDTNGFEDVYLFDRASGTTTLVSRSAASATTTGNGFSSSANLSRDGTLVAFVSMATNLVAGQTDTNDAIDVFLFDRSTGANVLLSRSTASATTTGDGSATVPVINGTGEYVAFTSRASNHVASDLNGLDDVFLATIASTPVCPPITATASGDSTVCAGSTATVTVTVSGGTPPYTITLSNGGGTLTAASPLMFTVSPTSTTTYTIQTGSDAAACPVTGAGSAVVTVNPQATPAAAGPDQTVCFPGSAALGANAPTVGGGAWSVTGGPSTSATQFSNVNSPTATFTPAGGVGAYTLRWTITPAPPCPVSTDDVVVTFTPPPTAAAAGPDQTICANDSATLAANVPTIGIGAWTVQGGPSTSGSQFSNVNAPNATFTPAGGAGTYTLRWAISNPPCPTSTDDVVVTVNAQASVSNAGPDQTLCHPNPATLGANTPTTGTGQWTVAGGPSTSPAQFSNVNSPTATFTPAGGPGAYVLRWTISGPPQCPPTMDDVSITFTAPPTAAAAGADQTVCLTSPTTLAANMPTTGSGQWTVIAGPSTSPAQFSNVNSPTATFTPAGGAGTYVLRWTISNGPCPSSSDDVSVVFVAAPTSAAAGSDQTVCLPSGVNLAANTPTIGNGQWTVNGGPSTSSAQFSNVNSPNATFTPAGGPGVYVLRWTISNAPCPASTDDVVISAVAAPTTSNAGSDQTLCVTAPATLAANAPTVGSGVWSVVSAPLGGSTAASQFADPSVPTTLFTPSVSVAGSYVLRWTISSPPCGTSFDDVSLSFVQSPTPAFAGPDQTLCVIGIAFLTSNSPAFGTASWSVVSGPSTAISQINDPTSTGARFTPAGGGGVYTLRWTIVNPPCSPSTDDVVMTVTALPTVADAGSNQTICDTFSTTLSANTPTVGSGVWTVTSGPSTAISQISDPTSPTATFTPAGGPGGYSLRWVISNPPCSSSNDAMSIRVNPAPTVSSAGPDQTLCVTAPATLAANAPTVGVGQWTVNGGPSTSPAQFSNVNSPTAMFTPAGGAGTYTLRWRITNAPCPASTDDVVVTFNAVPTSASAGADQTICNGFGTNLAANTPATGAGQWTVATGPNTSAGQFSNVNSPTAVFTPAGGPGVYTVRWTISNPPCAASTDDATVQVNPAPTVSNAGPDQTLCVTTPATLAANTPGVGAGSWSVVSGPGTSNTQFSNVNTPNAVFTPAGGPGMYTLRWTIVNAPCPSSTDDVALTFNSVPTVSNAGPDFTICLPLGGTLAANIPVVGTGTWSVASGPSTSASQFSNVNAPNAAFVPTGGPGVYTLRWTISNPPCAASTDDVSVTVLPSCSELPILYVPDRQNHRVQKYDGVNWTVLVGSGVPGVAPNQCNLPEAVAASFDGTRIYVADTGNNRITFSTDSGGSWAVFASSGIALHQVNRPRGLALDIAGNLYVSDTDNRRLLRFNGGVPGTAVLLANEGFGPGQVKSPRGLAVNVTGSLFVADKANHRVLRIANAALAGLNTGTIVADGPGIGSTQVNGPDGAAVDNLGNLFVADTENNRIVMFPGGGGPGTVTTNGLGAGLGFVNRPEGVTISRFNVGALAGQSLLIVGDTGGNRVEGRPLAGGAWLLVGVPNGLGSFPGQFRAPSRIR